MLRYRPTELLPGRVSLLIMHGSLVHQLGPGTLRLDRSGTAGTASELRNWQLRQSGYSHGQRTHDSTPRVHPVELERPLRLLNLADRSIKVVSQEIVS